MWGTGREWPWQVSGTYCRGGSEAMMRGVDYSTGIWVEVEVEVEVEVGRGLVKRV